MHSNPRFLADVARNGLKACSFPDCHGSRVGLNRWCKTHLRRARQLGHPEATAYRPRTWAKERAEVSTLFSANPSHPGLLQVLALLEGWMSHAVDHPQSFKGAPEVARLAHRGVAPLRLLTEVCAFWLWERSNPSAFPDDRARDWAMSRAVFALVPRDRRPVGSRGQAGTWGMSSKTPQSYSIKSLPSALGHVGKHLRQTLAVFLVTVAQGVDMQRAVKVDRLAMQRLPFAV